MLSYNILISQLKIGLKGRKEFVYVKYSNFVWKILTLLYKEGYILGFEKKENFSIKVYLKYFKKYSAILDIQLVSKGGRRIYLNYNNLKKIFGKGYNVVVSTSEGIYLYNKSSIFLKRGGEILMILK